MNEFTQVDNMIGNCAFAINFIAYPSEQIRKTLCTIQDSISSCMPANCVYKCPAHSLHMSVFQFVHSRKFASSNQALIWKKHNHEIKLHLQSITTETGICVLESPSIHVSESAIIIKFSPSDFIESLRDSLELSVVEFELSWNRPTIQHVTIFRYTHPFRLSDILNKISEIEPPDFTWKIDALNLVQESIYPSLNNNLVQTYTLR